MLTGSHAQQHVAAFADTLLSLKLSGYELIVYVLQIADASEWHLLLNVVAEPLATDGVAEYGGNDGAKEQTTIEHRLDGESAADSKRHTPVGTDIAHARRLALFVALSINDVELGEVIGQISIFSVKAGSACGEVPIILSVKDQTGTITEEVLVFECDLFSRPNGHDN